MKRDGVCCKILIKYHNGNSTSASFNKFILCIFNFLYRAQIIPCDLPQYAVSFAVKNPHFRYGKHDGIIYIPLQH